MEGDDGGGRERGMMVKERSLQLSLSLTAERERERLRELEASKFE